jgi:N-acetylmuramic acid-specific PTS system IIC component
MSKIDQEMMLNIIENIGGEANVSLASNCMTRLRLTLKDTSQVNKAVLQKTAGIMGVLEADGQLQLVMGPGKAQRGADAMNETLDQIRSGKISVAATAAGATTHAAAETVAASGDAPTLKQIAADNKSQLRANQKNPLLVALQSFLSKFAAIFTPLIPGFIGAGLLAGVAAILQATMVTGVATPNPTVVQFIQFINSFSKILFFFLPVLVGHNAQKAFGGSGVNGAIVGAFFIAAYGTPNAAGLSGAPISGMLTFFDHEIIQRGGVIGALIAAIFGAFVEKKVRTFIPDNFDMVLTSFFTLLIVGVATYLVIMPAAFALFKGMGWLFFTLNGNPFGAAILAGLFLISVVFGVHQGFVPVYLSLMEKVGYNTLFPILAVAGGGQVGAALALYVKSKKGSVLRSQIKGAIVPGFLGIGEPLIYGVTLPRGKPFVTACFGASVGGLFIGTMAAMGWTIGLNTAFGPSGLVGLPLMTSSHGIVTGMVIYLMGLLIAYVAGFIITLLFGIKGVDLD